MEGEEEKMKGEGEKELKVKGVMSDGGVGRERRVLRSELRCGGNAEIAARSSIERRKSRTSLQHAEPSG